jgi:hypothetical protein
MNKRALLSGLIAVMLAAPAYAIFGFSKPPLKFSQEDPSFAQMVCNLNYKQKNVTIENDSDQTLRNVTLHYSGYDQWEGMKPEHHEVSIIIAGKLGPHESITIWRFGSRMLVPGETVSFTTDEYSDPISYTVRK